MKNWEFRIKCIMQTTFYNFNKCIDKLISDNISLKKNYKTPTHPPIGFEDNVALFPIIKPNGFIIGKTPTPQ